MKSRPHNDTCITGLIGDYAAHLESRNYSPRSIDSYSRSLRDFGEYIATRSIERVEDIARKDLDAYRLHLVDRDFKPASVNAYMRAVRTFFRYLHEEQRIFLNPADGLIVGTPERRLQYVPTVGQVRRLLQQPDTSTPIGIRNRAILEVAYSAGLRRNELAGLRLQNVAPDVTSLRVMGKGGKERVVPLGRRAGIWLRKYLKEVRPALLASNSTDALWLKRPGRPLGHEGIAIVARNCAVAAGIKPLLTLHCLRRACATHMLQNGAHPIQIQMLLGHESLQHLSQYLKLSIAELKDAHGRSNPGQ